MNRIRTPLIVHGFALLHALVSILCLAGGVSDTILLTLLTIVMTIILALRRSLTMEVTAITVVLVNVAGFFLGTLGARLLSLFIDPPMLQRAAATFLTTEILGWTMVLFSGKESSEPVKIEPRKLAWLIVASALVFIIRILIDLGIVFDQDTQESFSRTLMFALLAEAAVCTVLYMVKLAIDYREDARRSQNEAKQAEFNYMILKHQVNPHFLFNSLNILDSLVLEGQKEEADEYIRKLAGIYRYMIGHEGENLVRLSDEMTFTEMYTALMGVRFPGGFTLENNVREEDMSSRVIPCSVQLLVENAFKHNAVSADNPLPIRIYSDGKDIIVENDLRPKLSHGQSTGLGQKYIRQQYKEMFNGRISVENDENKYVVRMPLL